MLREAAARAMVLKFTQNSSPKGTSSSLGLYQEVRVGKEGEGRRRGRQKRRRRRRMERRRRRGGGGGGGK
jgi:hypothetical protein